MSNAPVTAQPRSGVFPSYPPPSHKFEVGLQSKKRKRDGNISNDLMNDPFLIQPFPTVTSAKSRILQPLALIYRSCLPLSFLDLSSSIDYLGQTRLFKAYVKIFELEQNFGNEPMVLVARDVETRAHLAVEKERHGVYSICQLGSWANLQNLYDAAVASKPNFPKKAVQSDSHYSLSTPSILLGTGGSTDQKKRLAIEAIQTMVKKPSVHSETGPNPTKKELEPPLTQVESCSDPIPTLQSFDLSLPSQMTPSEIFENVRKQYLETLYLSRVSLAYFAKGPLSRARAAFLPENACQHDQKDYISFLQTLILPISLIDKKYKDGVPNYIQLCDAINLSEDDTSIKNKEKKKLRKSKLGKNGLYPTESLLIRKWWASYSDGENLNLSVAESTEEFAKTRMSQLRIRETQLQIILILEVLALKPQSFFADDSANHEQTALSENGSRNVKKTKLNNLLVLIDVHIDRLCIWQSVALESTEKLFKNPTILSDDFYGPTSRTKQAESFLKDFCVEVIIPFFSARLPTQCAKINRKLGVPIATPVEPKVPKSSNISAISRPGAATKRSLPGKPRPSLKRVLTDDRKRRSVSQCHSKAISLMKSATMPMIPIIKKGENEALSLPSTLAEESLQVKKSGSLESRGFTQRKVALVTIDTQSSTELNKKMLDEVELKDSIPLSKKPKQQLVTKGTSDLMRKRQKIASDYETSRRLPNSTLSERSIQIFATPKSRRSKPIIDKIENSCPQLEKNLLKSCTKISPPAPQSPSPSNVLDDFSLKNPFYQSVQATPIRKYLSSGPEDIDKNCNFNDKKESWSSPLGARRSSAQLFSSVTNSLVKEQNIDGRSGVIETPKKSMVEDESKNILWLRSGSHKQSSSDAESSVKDSSTSNIYQALGWE